MLLNIHMNTSNRYHHSILSFPSGLSVIDVIGIDPRTIDPIMKSKYGENTKIIGMNYLQKLVQLPFQIPIWRDVDISKVIRSIMIKTGIKESDIDEMINDSSIEMIITAAQLNPRDVKRFINTFVLSRYIFGQSIKDIERLIAVQAFYFRGNEWISVLRLITSFENRKNILKNFMLLLQRENDGGRKVSRLEELNKLIQNIKNGGMKFFLDRQTLEFIERLIELNDNDLLAFLLSSAHILLRIDKLEKYLRVVETSESRNKNEPSPDIDTERQLQLINDGKIPEFNAQERSAVHLPCEQLSGRNLDHINLSGSFLPFTFFTNAHITSANLSLADLSGADLCEANLSHSFLWATNFSYANLLKANLHRADLTGADLSRADLSEVLIIGVSYDANLRVHETNFKNAVIDDPLFIDYLDRASSSSGHAKFIPEKLKNKEELRKKLLVFGLREDIVESLVNFSKLPQ